MTRPRYFWASAAVQIKGEGQCLNKRSLTEPGKPKRVGPLPLRLFLRSWPSGSPLLIPLIYTDSLPKTQLTSFLVAPPPPPPPPPPPAAAAPVKVVKVAPRQFDAGRLMAPKQIPKDIAMIKEEELPPPSGQRRRRGRRPGRRARRHVRRRDRRHYRFRSYRGAASASASAPSRGRAGHPAADPRRRQRAGRQPDSEEPRRSIRRWPNRLAFRATVRFTAIIGKDGTIQNLTVVSGHPLLVPAAQDAVKQWVYKPTLLNGEPVEVVTQIDVNFTLSS